MTRVVNDIQVGTLQALRESESRYRMLMEQASDGIHTYDLEGNFIEVNSKLCDMLGYTREELLRLKVNDLIPPADLTANPIRFDDLRAGKTIISERRVRRKDGTLLPVEISGRMFQSGLLQAIIRDITSRKQAEGLLRQAHDELERRVAERTAELAQANVALQAEIAERQRTEETLRESEQRLRIALKTSKMGSWQLDLTTGVLNASNTCKANFGLPPEAKVSYKILFELIHPDDRARVSEAVNQAVESQSDYDAEYRNIWPDGSTHWIIARGRGLYDEGGKPLRMVGVTLDITERKQAEEARQELLRRLVTAQEEERRRIALELHDQMGQHLTALTLGFKSLSNVCRHLAPAQERIAQLQEMTDQLVRETHSLALELRPPALDDLGLHTAPSNYVEQWSERALIPIDFHSVGMDNRRLLSNIETTLYRIIQESLTNVLKHAGAHRVSLILEQRADHVFAIVEDDGCGFDVEAVLCAPIRERGLGLLGMRERVALVGGTFNLEASPGIGTTVFVRIPTPTNGNVEKAYE
jgi:PAS domain S-box-containing protein